jgi:hypothetical protein
MAARYMTTREVAEMLVMSEEWVREHAAELGGIRLGDSRFGALRFEVDRVTEAMEARRLDPPKRGRRRRPGPARKYAGDVELLPLPEEKG